MTVRVTKAAGHRAEITWEPGDDPHGYLAVAVEGDQLESALAALGSTTDGLTPDGESLAVMVRHTKELAQLLERRAAVLVLQLRDDHGMSWPQIAARVLGDPDKQSSARGCTTPAAGPSAADPHHQSQNDRQEIVMAKNDSREAWVDTQTQALYEDLCAREAAQAATTQDTTTVQGDRQGVTGGTHHGDLYFDYKG
ncbi:hypothetical protein GTY20_40010 [Streptomyces sp. SID4946]|uniref:hypothetical protein n=1 Tax=Streptomyces sp. LamerLS-31b TaxID=1839765 RepID=UPI00081F299F|nr:MULTISPECIES: hypothetical protein [unclassified Streptomyces]MYQ96950.1 hypothetical protein [Streptomyces sp. SID4946]SCF58434.1 hypothetical protein GA0115258_10131 [Streptomyces sp. LamerLS-31b]SCG02941.1 hypothetical protein GA0115256_14732 [Streptomyces sp. DconLS]